MGEGQKERETQNPKQAPGWGVSTEPDVGLEPTSCEIMIWAEVRCSSNWATQAPLNILILIYTMESGFFSIYSLSSTLRSPGKLFKNYYYLWLHFCTSQDFFNSIYTPKTHKCGKMNSGADLAWSYFIWTYDYLLIDFRRSKRKFVFGYQHYFKVFYFWDRAWTGEGQRERETQNLKQAAGSEWSAQSPMRGSNSQAVRSWPEPKSDAQPTEPPRRP